MNQVLNQDQVPFDMIATIKDLQKQITDIKSSKKETKESKGYTTRFNKSKYCHTHGTCAHESKFYKNKGPGHKYEATFENKMNGSTAFCQVVE